MYKQFSYDNADYEAENWIKKIGNGWEPGRRFLGIRWKAGNGQFPDLGSRRPLVPTMVPVYSKSQWTMLTAFGPLMYTLHMAKYSV